MCVFFFSLWSTSFASGKFNFCVSSVELLDWFWMGLFERERVGFFFED